MRRTRKLTVFMAAACVAQPAVAGCSGFVWDHVLSGVREGTITAATGIVNDFLDQRFAQAGTDPNQGGGNDLFITE